MYSLLTCCTLISHDTGGLVLFFKIIDMSVWPHTFTYQSVIVKGVSREEIVLSYIFVYITLFIVLTLTALAAPFLIESVGTINYSFIIMRQVAHILSSARQKSYLVLFLYTMYVFSMT